MNPHSVTLLRALATFRVTEIRFSVIRDGDTLQHSVPRARFDEPRTTEQSFPALSVKELFTAYALPPRKGLYTLRVADGQLVYEAPPARKITKVSVAKTRHRHVFRRRHEKLAA